MHKSYQTVLLIDYNDYSKYKYISSLHSLFNGHASRSAKIQEKLIGRLFLPLQKISLEGEDRCLPLDAKRPDGVAVLIHLSVKGSQVRTPALSCV